VEKLWHRLGQEFARSGHSVTLISRLCDGLPSRSDEEGVRHFRVPGYDQPSGALGLKIRDLQYTLRAWRVLPESDVVVTNTFWAPLVLGHRWPVYVDVERMPKGQMKLYRSARRLRAPSAAVAAEILRDDSTAKSRVRVIPSPLPFVPQVPVSWDQKEQTILYVGRLHPEKGIDLLLGAFAEARKGGSLREWKLRLIGPVAAGKGGGGEVWLEGLKARIPQEGVEWVGPIYDMAALSEEYHRATVFAYPSVAESGETFGLAPLEAMAWGCAPVVSDLACFRDYLCSGRNGLVFNHRGPGSVERLAHTLIEAAAHSRELGNQALEVRSTHAPERIAAEFIGDFRTLTELSRPSS